MLKNSANYKNKSQKKKKSYDALKFMSLCWAAFPAVLRCAKATGRTCLVEGQRTTGRGREGKERQNYAEEWARHTIYTCTKA